MENADIGRPKRVALYLRVSTEEQAERYGLDVQEEALRKLIESRKHLGFSLAGKEHVYKDVDVSGTIPVDERPGFARLKEALLHSSQYSKPFDAVAVFKIDRFARKLTVLLDIISFFEQQEIEFISAHESIDTSTPFGRAILGIIGVIAELEVETIKIRMQGGRSQAAKEGIFMGTTPPYGYRKNEQKKLVIFQQEAEIVSQIFQSFAIQGHSLQKIADDLKAREILTPKVSAEVHSKTSSKAAKKYGETFWLPTVVRDILRNEIYIGKLYYGKSSGGKVLPRSRWLLSEYSPAPIIDNTLFRIAQERLNAMRDSHVNYGSHAKHTYTLSSLLRCAHCYNADIDYLPQNWVGERKRISRQSNKYTYMYKCRRKNSKKSSIPCSTIPLPAKEIEDYVADFVRTLLANPADAYRHYGALESTRASKKFLNQNIKQLKRVLEGTQPRKKKLLKQHELSLLTDNELALQINDLAKQEETNRSKLRELEENLNSLEMSDQYRQTIGMFADRYKERLDELFADREQSAVLFRMLIKDILVYSRAVDDKDVIAGRKKAEQYIPNKLLIRLRLPSEIMTDVMRDAINHYAPGAAEKIAKVTGIPTDKLTGGFGVNDSKF